MAEKVEEIKKEGELPDGNTIPPSGSSPSFYFIQTDTIPTCKGLGEPD